MIGLLHIQISARNFASAMSRRLGLAIFKVNDHLALPVLARLTIPLAKPKVAAIAVHFADGGHQIMHIRLHRIELFALFCAIFATALLPALQLMTKFPSGHYVFPLNTVGAGLLFAHLIATAIEIGLPGFPLNLDIATTVKADCRQGTVAAAEVE